MLHIRRIHPRRGSSPGREGSCRARPWARASAIVVAVLLASALLDACGSSSPTASSAELKRTCKQVEAVLSDGPEPAADPVGYAQAQILPLRQVHTSDRELREAIRRLAAAYQAFSSSNGASSTKGTVTAARKTVEGLCPGIES